MSRSFQRNRLKVLWHDDLGLGRSSLHFLFEGLQSVNRWLLRRVIGSHEVVPVRGPHKWWEFTPKHSTQNKRGYCSFAYSTLACFRMGMSGSASFQRARKSWYAAFALAVSPWSA